MSFNRVSVPPQKQIENIALEAHFAIQALAPHSKDC
jgi:hypothetical protein